jgi:hypothetical protein
LGDVLVLDQTIFGSSSLAEVDTEFEELDEDGLESAERGATEALRREDFGNGREGGGRLVDGEKLIRSLFVDV